MNPPDARLRVPKQQTRGFVIIWGLHYFPALCQSLPHRGDPPSPQRWEGSGTTPLPSHSTPWAGNPMPAPIAHPQGTSRVPHRRRRRPGRAAAARGSPTAGAHPALQPLKGGPLHPAVQQALRRGVRVRVAPPRQVGLGPRRQRLVKAATDQGPLQFRPRVFLSFSCLFLAGLSSEFYPAIF